MLIYCLDDDELELSFWEIILTNSKPEWKVKSFNNTEAFMCELADTPPDVAIVDLVMPYADGVAVCRAMQTYYPDISVFINTGLSGDEFRVLADRCSATYMNKNTKFEERLQVIINGCVDKS